MFFFGFVVFVCFWFFRGGGYLKNMFHAGVTVLSMLMKSILSVVQDVAVNEEFLKVGKNILKVRNIRIQTGPLLTKGEFKPEYVTVARQVYYY